MADINPVSPPAAEPEGDASKRAAKRDSLFLLADLFTDTGRSRGKARVRNLSETGMMADCEGSFCDGDRIVIHLRGIGEVSGHVSWVRGGRIGMTFDSRIDPQAARKPIAVRSSQPLAGTHSLPRATRFTR